MTRKVACVSFDCCNVAWSCQW